MKPICKHNGQGCIKEDYCSLSNSAAAVSCGLYLYFNFLDDFNQDNTLELDTCTGLEIAEDMGCPDLTSSGKCLDRQTFCQLMLYTFN